MQNKLALIANRLIQLSITQSCYHSYMDGIMEDSAVTTSSNLNDSQLSQLSQVLYLCKVKLCFGLFKELMLTTQTIISHCVKIIRSSLNTKKVVKTVLSQTPQLSFGFVENGEV